jgi:predicted transglutaminase-like cysteine proteinase
MSRWLRALCSALALCVCAPPAAIADPAELGLGGRGVVVSNTQSLIQWANILTRYRAQRTDSSWRALIAAASMSADPIRTANMLVNAATFVGERGDAWVTPIELLRRGGDCEDFAIAKYFLLIELGVSMSDLRLVAQRGPDHMVLLVHARGGEWLVLDNLSRDPQPYWPGGRDIAYAFNGDALWVVLR